MNSVDLLKSSLAMSRQLLEWIVSDLSDADLLVRPVPEANHFAWQLGHLINSERNIVQEQVPGAAMPELPEAFRRLHEMPLAEGASAAFPPKEQYLAWLAQVRDASIAALSGLTDKDLDQATTGNLASFFPTLGSVFGMLSDHIYMHLGQASVVRRKLGKPVLF